MIAVTIVAGLFRPVMTDGLLNRRHAARGTPFAPMLTDDQAHRNAHSHTRTNTMDKLVRRVTVVQGRDAKVVYQSDDDP